LHPDAPSESTGEFISNPQPPSTLLLPGATTVDLSIETAEATSCGYSLGADAPLAEMVLFSEGAGGTVHRTTLRGLDPDPSFVNRVYVGCESAPDRLLLMYRSLPEANPSFPRTGNLWGQWEFEEKGLDYMARIDLWLGADMLPSRIRELRELNPDILILASINAVENYDLPDDYYLKDIHGNRIEVWPGSYRLNLTKPEVADYQAGLACRIILDNDLMYDGMFFDNVMTTQSWQQEDIYGNPFLWDANEDGVQDDPAEFDAAWNAGVFREIRTFRELMPHAIVSGHSMWIDEPGIAELFNGISIGFVPADVLEGERPFDELWEGYNKWMTLALEPRITMLEASPPDQIAYGYDFSPWEKTPPSTLEFARTMYPYMRFGLGLTLMQDGYFAYEYGDTWHGNDWWYDELDFDLGFPREPARRIALGDAAPPQPLPGGDFEVWSDAGPWGYWADEESGYRASFALDEANPGAGGSSARADVSAAPGEDWRISLYADGIPLVAGEQYELVFRARADRARPITVGAQKGSPNWEQYSRFAAIQLTPEWREYTFTFEATGTDSNARLHFLLGDETGSVWIDNVRLGLHPPEIFRREFDNGLVLLNPTKEVRTITLEPGWRRLKGDQAPRREWLADDSGTGFTASPAEVAALDTEEWLALGPFFHSWLGGLHLVAGGGAAEWRLEIPESGKYSIDAWWPAAPERSGWNTAARFEVRVNNARIGAISLDQTVGGDEWHPLGEFTLPAEGNVVVRMVCPGALPCAADALYLRSAARYNDGTPAREITLQPLDAIVLQRDEK
jgi:hypothetical protein